MYTCPTPDGFILLFVGFFKNGGAKLSLSSGFCAGNEYCFEWVGESKIFWWSNLERRIDLGLGECGDSNAVLIFMILGWAHTWWSCGCDQMAGTWSVNDRHGKVLDLSWFTVLEEDDIDIALQLAGLGYVWLERGEGGRAPIYCLVRKEERRGGGRLFSFGPITLHLEGCKLSFSLYFKRLFWP